ncbi:MAG: hypothetical protein JWP89_1226 [Schlesneria sp.]|nr:hypothetical protein [Schlesneria sp.]
MRSIPYAMTWELLRRGRWQMLLAVLGANLLSLLLLMALRMDGPLDLDDPGLITMQVVLIQFQPLLFAVAIFASIDLSSRSYVLPIPTSTLVAWKMIPSMILMFLESILSALALNWLFNLHWPLWGPAFLSAVSLAMILAALWYAQGSIYLPFCVGIGGTIIGLWYKSRWGPIFTLPTHAWSSVSPLEAITMILFAVASYFVAVAGVTRSRRGEVLGADGAWLWLDRLFNWTFDTRADKELRFATPQEAHFWCEWTKKGWVLPAVVSCGLVFGLAAWTVFSRKPADMMEALIAGGGILSAIGMLGGILVGNTGPTDSSYEMGSFLGTRPLTDRDLSTTTLKVLAKSVLYSWLIWAAVFVVVTGNQWLSGQLVNSPIFQKLYWWYLPITLLGAWIANSVIASLSLTGHSSLWVKIACVVFACYVAVLLSSKLLDYDSRAWLLGGLMVLTGIAASGISIYLVVAARRNSLISQSLMILGASIWVALSAVIIAESFRSLIPPSAVVLMIGVASLAISPLAAAPLAVTWNRHR